ncbi:ArsR family transcriptional regulator [Halalkaliarchaeum desulfuricum]|uniref:ArsR family transcriptional regulator n=1 Tax=Halalkaliarchaeum desulfuricum TaxID=2055893 RepID=A0A343TGU2_9EURY|nr:helix-turn-helix domain-containing protein [Halalkaliarchaeum desulfuricum]AUX08314.1 ArsR family transcriptional regulator [Halalkaliarchaeum desulfuricum]
MIDEKEFRVLSALESPKDRQELSEELEYQEATISDAFGGLERRNLITRERVGTRSVAKPSDARCVEVFQSLTKANPHVDFADLLTPSMLNMLYYLGSDDPWTATELAERTGHNRSTIYRNLRTLTNRAMVTKEHSQYRLRAEFDELHVFAYELRHHVHRVTIKRDVEGGTIVWESHDEFLVRTDGDVEDPNYHRTGLDAFAEYGLQFFTTSEQYYFYSEDRESLTPADLVCHLLLIENDSRHRKYALLLVAETGLTEEDLEETARNYGIEDIVMSLVEFLRTDGEITAEQTPQWEEFEALASEYEVDRNHRSSP